MVWGADLLTGNNLMLDDAVILNRVMHNHPLIRQRPRLTRLGYS